MNAKDENAQPTCEAQVDEPPGYWHTHTCGKPARFEVDGHPVCGIHKRVADRGLRLMGWKPR